MFLTGFHSLESTACISDEVPRSEHGTLQWKEQKKAACLCVTKFYAPSHTIYCLKFLTILDFIETMSIHTPNHYLKLP